MSLLEEQMNLRENSDERMLRKETTDEEISSIMFHWTGIPHSKLMRGDRENF